MRVAILTSSRADYGIYLPLLKKLKKDSFFDVHLIVFGTHLSLLHGHTIDAIIDDGFTIDHSIEHILPGDSPFDIASSMSTAALKFSTIWQKEKKNYDLVFCLGDRYEMFAAVSAAIPFNINFAHVHGGETTLGAIDDKFRHCLSIFSTLHFVSTESYAERVARIVGDRKGIYTIGALSLDNLEDISLLSNDEFSKKYGVDVRKPIILVTYHPETIGIEKNEEYANQLMKALQSFNDNQIVITMPNADTMGNTMRKIYEHYATSTDNIRLVENFGTVGYYTCLNLCRIVAGNSSSGIIEAASFKKYVVDIGNRQKGRAVSGNVIHAEPDSGSIIQACRRAINSGAYTGKNIYYKQNASNAIIEVLRKWV